MARTLKGNRTGRAGADDLAEQREMILAEQEKQHELAQQYTKYWIVLLDGLRWLDPLNWSDWYDKNVPKFEKWQDAWTPIRVVRARVKELLLKQGQLQSENDAETFLKWMVVLHNATITPSDVDVEKSTNPAANQPKEK